MTNLYRAMCAELIDAIFTPNPYNWEDSLHDSANRASALLDQPEPSEPTDEELYELWVQNGFENDRFARAVLAKWGNQ